MTEVPHKQIYYSGPQLQPGNSKLIAFLQLSNVVTLLICIIAIFVLK